MSDAATPHSPSDREVRLLYRARGVVAIHKPSGLATQAPPGMDSTESRVRRLLSDGGAGGYLAVPHRLDRAVSGVMLFAETPRAARQLSRQFERRQVVKRYRAIVVPTVVDRAADGRADDPVGPAWREWRDWVAKRRGLALAGVVDPDGAHRIEESEPPREALTRVRAVGWHRGHDVAARAGVDWERLLELECEPVTGRMHQIRVQAAARGLPVLGDVAYGCPPPSCEPEGFDPRLAAIALHATRITYLDPDSGRPITVACDPPWQRDAPGAPGDGTAGRIRG